MNLEAQLEMIQMIQMTIQGSGGRNLALEICVFCHWQVSSFKGGAVGFLSTVRSTAFVGHVRQQNSLVIF